MGLLKKKIGLRVGIIGNMIVFFFSGIDSFENAGILMCTVNMAGAAINLAAFFMSKKSPVKTTNSSSRSFMS